MSADDATKRLIAWCEQERAQCLRTLEAFKLRGMRMWSQSGSQLMSDVTREQIDRLEKLVADLEIMIEELTKMS